MSANFEAKKVVVEEIKQKIEKGITEEPHLSYDKKEIEEIIKKIKRIKSFKRL